MEPTQGKISINRKGFGFIRSGEKEFFVPKQNRNGSLHDDLVEFRIVESGMPESNAVVFVTKVLERKKNHLVATVIGDRGRQKLIADDERITEFLKITTFQKLKNQHKILCKIERVFKNTIFVSLVKEIGHVDSEGIAVQTIIDLAGLKTTFPFKVKAQAQKISDTVQAQDKRGRRDLTSETIITIDGASAKDLDDAIKVDKLANGHYRLGVYIADVSHYVTRNSELDLEAFKRATSVYLVNQVIPMLPEKLSNGICSLNPQVERLVMACEMEINDQGQVVDFAIFKAVIKTTHQMTYQKVNAIIAGDQDLKKQYQEILPLINNAHHLSQIIHAQKKKEGMIDFDIAESEIKIDADNKVEINSKIRGVSERIIEDFMVMANETVARALLESKGVSLYRVHDLPLPEKLAEFHTFARQFGKHFTANKTDVKPKDIQDILDLYQNEPYFDSIVIMALRMMDKASYAPKNIGHFGLGSKCYTHFTSPIRRYPDLIIHRLLNDYLIEKKMKEAQGYWNEVMTDIAGQCSKQERGAIDCERSVSGYYKALWAQQNLGQKFKAQIISINSFGFFVRLDNAVEGLIHVRNLFDDNYQYQEKTNQLQGEKGKRIFSLGQKITIFILNALPQQGKIDFGLQEFYDLTINRKEEEKKEKARFKESEQRSFQRFGQNNSRGQSNYRSQSNSRGSNFGKRENYQNKNTYNRRPNSTNNGNFRNNDHYQGRNHSQNNRNYQGNNHSPEGSDFKQKRSFGNKSNFRGNNNYRGNKDSSGNGNYQGVNNFSKKSNFSGSKKRFFKK